MSPVSGSTFRNARLFLLLSILQRWNRLLNTSKGEPFETARCAAATGMEMAAGNGSIPSLMIFRTRKKWRRDRRAPFKKYEGQGPSAALVAVENERWMVLHYIRTLAK
jgi:hypothetical protein